METVTSTARAVRAPAIGPHDDMVARRAIDLLRHGIERDGHAGAEPFHHAAEAVAHRPVAAVQPWLIASRAETWSGSAAWMTEKTWAYGVKYGLSVSSNDSTSRSSRDAGSRAAPFSAQSKYAP